MMGENAKLVEEVRLLKEDNKNLKQTQSSF